jgi:hypothetical protein
VDFLREPDSVVSSWERLAFSDCTASNGPWEIKPGDGLPADTGQCKKKPQRFRTIAAVFIVCD